jgi:hypothetical protein
MDWSLMDPSAKRPFLRKHMGFKQPWPYYLAMFIDPIIRSDWFLYIVYANQLQHSALLSFLLALAEVVRRFIWCFFRMENEHVGNVGANRAYRDLPLPYHLPNESLSPSDEEAEPIEISHTPIVSEQTDLERMETLRRRITRSGAPSSPAMRTMTKVGRTMNQAHMHDYERRRNRDEEAEMSGESEDEDEDSEDYYERTREAETTRGRTRSGTVGTLGSRT